MKHLGIDYGTKRIGVALSDEGGVLAFPHSTVVASREALSHIDALIKKESVQKVIIGESRNLKGEPNEVMEDIEQFAKDLRELSGVEVIFEPEFFSSTLAARQFTPDGSRKQNPAHKNLDASAAALILQSYLDRQGNKL